VAVPASLEGAEYASYQDGQGTGVATEQRVVLYAANGTPLIATPVAMADGAANPTIMRTATFPMTLNAAGTWDRSRAGDADTTIGSQKVALISPAGTRLDAIGSNVDAAPGTRYLGVGAALFNGASWDRPRGNLDTAALITAAGATTTQTSADQTNYNGCGVVVLLNLTVNAGGLGSITLTIDGKDAASGAYYNLLTGAALAAVASTSYIIFPSVAAVANRAVAMGLPRVWRVVVTANNANPTSYTVGACVMTAK